MKNGRFAIYYAILLLLQLVLAKNGQMSYLYVSLLPVMILSLPTDRPTWWTILVAFFSGILVDGLADGVMGLNACAIVPVAVLQKTLIRRCIDDDLVNRGYSFSFHQNGYFKIGLALLLAEFVFFVIYIAADSAGCRTFAFNFTKGLISIVVSFILGMFAVQILDPRQKR